MDIALIGGLTALVLYLEYRRWDATRQISSLTEKLESEKRISAIVRTTSDFLATRLAERSQGDERGWEREADLIRQVQSMAERIATLRQGPLPVGGEGQFTPTKHEKPYSTDLQLFLSQIETSEARDMVELEIERQRSNGIEDEQIYKIVSKGEVIRGE